MARVTKEMTMENCFRHIMSSALKLQMFLQDQECIASDAQASIGESLADAAYVHGIDSDLLVEKLNATINAKLGE